MSVYNVTINSLGYGGTIKQPEYERDRWQDIRTDVPPKTMGQRYDLWGCIAKSLEETGDTFLFTLARQQEEHFRKRFDELEKYKVLETPYVMNPNYPGSPPKIKFIVLKGAKAK